MPDNYVRAEYKRFSGPITKITFMVILYQFRRTNQNPNNPPEENKITCLFFDSEQEALSFADLINRARPTLWVRIKKWFKL